MYTLVVYARSAQQWFPMTTHLSVHQAGTPYMAIDTPLDGTVVGSGQPFVVSGWAIDYDHVSNRGTDAIHVWAVPVSGGSPIFAGGSLLGDARPDVTAAFGSQFLGAGYHVVVEWAVSRPRTTLPSTPIRPCRIRSSRALSW